jgi:hypothetical protein
MGAGSRRWWRDDARYVIACAEFAATTQPQRYFPFEALAGTTIVRDAVHGVARRLAGHDVPVIDLRSGRRIA